MLLVSESELVSEQESEFISFVYIYYKIIFIYVNNYVNIQYLHMYIHKEQINIL